MDINVLRSLATVVSFITFIGILAWAWSRTNKQSFDEAAQLPFDQE
ncbi:CcoQ/FixQ family Cbb3-type cytochrome c oxidase assembly chaperone [Pseudorhodoferax sp. Leaf274]|nr:CcoQ/FixQ family Cbb3-type cytochrome c oxidase assembly chaperone [Pseudorhodoferax sp. Leaf274]KQP44588.1 cytochrome oxidase [Pseudorhodoferax sp. Leaf274]